MQSLDMEVESMPLCEDDWQNLGYFAPEQDIEDAQASFAVPQVVAHPAPVEEIPSPPLSPLVSREHLLLYPDADDLQSFASAVVFQVQTEIPVMSASDSKEEHARKVKEWEERFVGPSDDEDDDEEEGPIARRTRGGVAPDTESVRLTIGDLKRGTINPPPAPPPQPVFGGQGVPKKRGRPLGSKSKEGSKKPGVPNGSKRGRPPGSKSKEGSKKPGVPKGSKRAPKEVVAAPVIVAEAEEIPGALAPVPQPVVRADDNNNFAAQVSALTKQVAQQELAMKFFVNAVVPLLDNCVAACEATLKASDMKMAASMLTHRKIVSQMIDEGFGTFSDDYEEDGVGGKRLRDDAVSRLETLKESATMFRGALTFQQPAVKARKIAEKTPENALFGGLEDEIDFSNIAIQ